eukprot:scaffold270_cov121-Isochrysis_galbana.AAC.13
MPPYPPSMSPTALVIVVMAETDHAALEPEKRGSATTARITNESVDAEKDRKTGGGGDGGFQAGGQHARLDGAPVEESHGLGVGAKTHVGVTQVALRTLHTPHLKAGGGEGVGVELCGGKGVAKWPARSTNVCQGGGGVPGIEATRCARVGLESHHHRHVAAHDQCGAHARGKDARDSGSQRQRHARCQREHDATARRRVAERDTGGGGGSEPTRRHQTARGMRPRSVRAACVQQAAPAVRWEAGPAGSGTGRTWSRSGDGGHALSADGAEALIQVRGDALVGIVERGGAARQVVEGAARQIVRLQPRGQLPPPPDPQIDLGGGGGHLDADKEADPAKQLGQIGSELGEIGVAIGSARRREQREGLTL